MKKCFKCNKEKSISEFYKHPQMRDGHLNKCILCAKKDVSLRYNNIAKDPEWIIKERARGRDKYRRLYRGNKKERENKERNKKYYEKYPEKYAAKVLTNNAIKRKRLVKQPCEICGDTNVHAHHDDYYKPLEVRWLCIKHHEAYHVEQRELILRSHHGNTKT